jgi:hypothetical protein
VTHPGLTDLGAYLTAIELSFYDPASQITSDLHIVQAATDEPVNTTRTETRIVAFGGIPLGWLIVVLSVIVFIPAVIVVAVVLGRRAMRRGAATPHA